MKRLKQAGGKPKLLYCTADKIGGSTGGGVVTQNERDALKQLGQVIEIERHTLEEAMKGLPFDPFICDCIAEDLISDISTPKIAHFYAGTFTRTIKALKNKGSAITYMCDAHDKSLSQNEHEKLGIAYNYPHMYDPRLWKMYVGGYINSDCVICPSSRSADIMTSFGCKNITIIPHGIYIPNEMKDIPNNKVVLYLGQPGPDKGLVYLLAAWKKLNIKDGLLVLAGRGTEMLTPLVRLFGGGNIRIMGYVDDVSEVYNNCAIYVQPSVTEGFGIEILEAMAHGRTVIASVGAGASECISDGVDGFVVPIRSPDAIAERLSALLGNFNIIKSMGNAARKKANRYGWPIIRKMYTEMWGKL